MWHSKNWHKESYDLMRFLLVLHCSWDSYGHCICHS
jgi:hypothetical protein